MKTTPLEILKIHTLTQGQYERALEEGRINDNELYLTPNEYNDLSFYTTKDELKEYAVPTDMSICVEIPADTDLK